MKLENVLQIYELISASTIKNSSNETIKIRKKVLENLSKDMVKVAFDTRKIDQEEDYNPRRGLQHYHRSEKFISEAIQNKIHSFKKLFNVLNVLKNDYSKEPEWQDSYTRVLHASVHKTLNACNDFSDSQPAMTSLNYLEELLYVRYRLTPDTIVSLSEEDLRNNLLSKDESLTKQGYLKYTDDILPSDVSKYSYDQMIDKILLNVTKNNQSNINPDYDKMVDKMLSTMTQVMTSFKIPQADDNLTNKLFDVKATKENPEIERVVTITIKDKISDNIEKNSNKELLNQNIKKSTDKIENVQLDNEESDKE